MAKIESIESLFENFEAQAVKDGIEPEDIQTDATAVFEALDSNPPRTNFAGPTFIKDDKFTVPSVDAEVWRTRPYGDNGTKRGCCAAEGSRNDQPHYFMLFMGSFIKTATDRNNHKEVSTVVKVKKNGRNSVLNLEDLESEGAQWRAIAGKTFKVSKVTKVPVTKEDYRTGREKNSTTHIYEFVEV